MNKRAVLAGTDFGRRIAEEEADVLVSYFVETEEWRKVFSGEIDIVYGPKGSGKSAIYSLLLEKTQDLLERQIIVLAGEDVRGTPVFSDLVTEVNASEEQLRGMWKFYFLSILGRALREHSVTNRAAKEVLNALEEAGLVSQEKSLRRIFRAAWDYVRRFEISGEVRIDPSTGQPIGIGKITLREPSLEEQKKGFISADSLLQMVDEALAQASLHFWIALDRLDVAFADSAELEGRALRTLFRVYRDMGGLKNISLKIFLRDDIWQRVTEQGLREASHITRYMRIDWSPQALLNLVIRRAIHNETIRSHYGVRFEEVLANAELQEELFYRIFPSQVDSGSRKVSTLDWILSRTQDGKSKTAPREVIHLISAARDYQLKLLDVGNPEPEGETLIDRSALKEALPLVSKARFEQTLCAEHPLLKSLLLRLEAEKTEQTPDTLAKIWNVSEQEALTHAEKLTEVGFFEKRGSKEQPTFWVPFLYRDALKMVQGRAK